MNDSRDTHVLYHEDTKVPYSRLQQKLETCQATNRRSLEYRKIRDAKIKQLQERIEELESLKEKDDGP